MSAGKKEERRVQPVNSLEVLDKALLEAGADLIEFYLELWQRLRLAVERDDKLGEGLVVDG